MDKRVGISWRMIDQKVDLVEKGINVVQQNRDNEGQNGGINTNTKPGQHPLAQSGGSLRTTI